MNAEPTPSEVPPLTPATPPLRRRGWWIHLLLLAAYPLVLGTLSVDKAKFTAPALGSGARDLFLVCIVQMVSFGLIFGLAWLGSRASIDQLLLRWRGGFKAWLWGFGYSIAIRLMLVVIVAMIAAMIVLSGAMSQQAFLEFFKTNRPNVESLVDVDALKSNPVYFWLTITLVSFVVAGLREELWRSGLLAGLGALWPRWFGSLWGRILAVGVAAVIFGLGHLMQGMLAVGLTALLGFALGLIMVFHRSIWPAVIAHGMFDATTFAMLPFLFDQIAA